MVNGPLHAGDITAGEPIYMRSLARVRTLRYVKPSVPALCDVRCPVVKAGPVQAGFDFERLSNNITTFRFVHDFLFPPCVRACYSSDQLP